MSARGPSRAARCRREVELLAREARTWAVASVGQAVLAVGLVVLGLAHSPAWWALAWVAAFGAALTISRWRFCRELRAGYAQHLRELRRAAVTAQEPGRPAPAGRWAATHRPSIAPAPTPQMDLAERGAGLFLRGAR